MAAVIRGIDLLSGHIGAVVEDLAGGGGLQQVDAPEQSGFAGAGGATLRCILLSERNQSKKATFRVTPTTQHSGKLKTMKTGTKPWLPGLQ